MRFLTSPKLVCCFKGLRRPFISLIVNVLPVSWDYRDNCRAFGHKAAQKAKGCQEFCIHRSALHSNIYKSYIFFKIAFNTGLPEAATGLIVEESIRIIVYFLYLPVPGRASIRMSMAIVAMRGSKSPWNRYRRTGY